MLNIVNTNAFCAPFNPIEKALDNTELSNDSVISISVKETGSAKTVYSKRQDMLLNPASTLKVFTMAAALDTFGEGYNFETVIYLDKDKNLYLKLGADPLLTSDNLDTLIKTLKKVYTGKIKNFYIDDTVIDRAYYPAGWGADDLWPNSAKISPYMIDSNSVLVNFYIQEDRKSIKITQNDDYKFSFINELEVSDTTNIIPSLNYGEKSGIISLSGTISKNLQKDFPVLDTGEFFTLKLRNILNKNGISYSKPFYAKKVPPNTKRIASFRRPIKDVITHILKTSDNFCTEAVFKAAGSKWAEESGEYLKRAYGDTSAKFPKSGGTFENGKAMFLEYYQRAGLNNDKINLADASGVSRYNALSTSWMTNALIYLEKHSKIKDYMITSDEGTLQRRMRDLKGNLKAKTGTLFGVSSLCGYITSLSGVDYAFSIIIQNFGVRASVIKGLEDDIVRGIYSF